MAAALMAAAAVQPAMSLPVVRRSEEEDDRWRGTGHDPDNRGRRAEKAAIALAKAEEKRRRKAAKRIRNMTLGSTAMEIEGEAALDDRDGSTAAHPSTAANIGQ